MNAKNRRRRRRKRRRKCPCLVGVDFNGPFAVEIWCVLGIWEMVEQNRSSVSSQRFVLTRCIEQQWHSFGRPTRSSRSLRSTGMGLLLVPFAHATSMQSGACCVVGPTVWNDLPLALRLLHRILSYTFHNQFKTSLVDRARVESTSE